MTIDPRLAPVMSAVSADDTRPHMCSPFGNDGYIVGTDGHRVHAYRHPDAATFARADAPPISNVRDSVRHHTHRATIDIATPGWDDLLVAFPRAWVVSLGLDAAGAYIAAHQERARGRDRTAIVRSPVEPFVGDASIARPWRVDLRSLIDAVQFVGMVQVRVWAGHDPLDPIVLTSSSVDAHPGDADRFAIVAPMRA